MAVSNEQCIEAINDVGRMMFEKICDDTNQSESRKLERQIEALELWGNLLKNYLSTLKLIEKIKPAKVSSLKEDSSLEEGGER